MFVESINSNAQISWSYRLKYVEQTFGMKLSKTDVSESYQTYATGFNYGLRFRLIFDAHLGVNGSVTNDSFSESLSEKDSVQTVIGTSFSKKSKNPNLPEINMSMFIGENIPTASQKTNGKNIQGLRVGMQHHFKKYLPLSLNLSSGVLYSSYKEKQFSVYRDDILSDVSLLATMRPWKSWETSIKTSLIKNNSNIELYQYTRINSVMSIKKYF